MKFADLNRRVWRIGYRPDPWEWADWRWAGAGGRFTGRWDALDGGLYRTIYAGESLFACLVELLAPLRPDPILVADLDQIVADSDDDTEFPTVTPGVVDVDDWVKNRVASTAQLNGRFCIVTAAESVASLRPLFHATAVSLYGLHDFDTAALKIARPRELTQAVSQYLWSARGYAGADLCDGIQFLSRHGDDLVLWALFERGGDGQVSPRLSRMKEQELSRTSPEVVEAFRFLGLRMHPLTP